MDQKRVFPKRSPPPTKGGNGRELATPIPPPGGSALADPRAVKKIPRGSKPGKDPLEIDEVTYLRVQVLQLKGALLVAESSKLESDQRLIDVTRENLQHRVMAQERETTSSYGRLGIRSGDKVVEIPDGPQRSYRIIRGEPKK